MATRRRPGPGSPPAAGPVCEPLRPSDRAEVARLHAAAFQGEFLSLLGPRALERFYGWFAGHGGIGFVARVQGRCVGFAMGWCPAYGWAPRLLRDLKWTLAAGAIRGLVAHPVAMGGHLWRRRRWVARRLRNRAAQGGPVRSEERRASLDSIAVAPPWRGTGVARGLLDRFVAEAARRGATAAMLSVGRENGRARRFYEREGWRLLPEERDRPSARYRLDLPGEEHEG